MAPPFHFQPNGHTPHQDKDWKLSSLFSCILPSKTSNHLKEPNRSFDKFNSEKVEDSSLKQGSPSSGSSRCNTAMSGPVRSEPYHWPHNSGLEPATTALVIIDMQRDFCEDGGYMAAQGYDISSAQNVVPKIKSILVPLREAGYPIYFTREGHRSDLSTLSSRELYRSRNNEAHLGIGDRGPLGRLLIRGEPGHDIIQELRPLENEPIIDKPGRGAFAHTDFELLLRIKGISNLIICGVTTDVCVTSTLREANDRRFDCVLVSDACAAGEVALHDGAIQSIKEEGGIFGAVTTAEELLRALKQTNENSQDNSLHVGTRPSSLMPPASASALSTISLSSHAVDVSLQSTSGSDSMGETNLSNGLGGTVVSPLSQDVPANDTPIHKSPSNKRSYTWKNTLSRLPTKRFMSATTS